MAARYAATNTVRASEAVLFMTWHGRKPHLVINLVKSPPKVSVLYFLLALGVHKIEQLVGLGRQQMELLAHPLAELVAADESKLVRLAHPKGPNHDGGLVIFVTGSGLHTLYDVLLDLQHIPGSGWKLAGQGHVLQHDVIVVI